MAAEEADHVSLLGSHPSDDGGNTEGETSDVPWDRGTLSQVAADLEDGLEQGDGTAAGSGSELSDLFQRVLDSQMALREDVLMRFATRLRADRFMESKRLQR